MASDLQRLLRAVKRIARFAGRYRQEDIAAALLKDCTPRERADVGFVGQYLLDVWELNRKPELEAEPRCCECGKNIHDAKDGIARRDARYCSPVCRTRAYRKRVTVHGANNGQKRHASAVRDGSRGAYAE